MSKLLEDLIAQKRNETISYEEFLRQAEELVQNMAKKAPTNSVPASLHGKPEAIIIFNNLPSIMADPMSSMMEEESPQDLQRHADLAIEIDITIREKAPAGWKEDIDGPRGKQVLNALFPLMKKDRRATQALFDLIKNQPGYS